MLIVISIVNGVVVPSYTPLLFHLISFSLFVVGACCFIPGLARPSFTPNWLFWITCITVLLGALSFIVFVDQVSLEGEKRGYGEDYELNPIGVAYVYMSLAVVFGFLVIASRRLTVRVAGGLGCALSLVVVITSASRGPILFGVVALLVVIFSYV